MVVGEGVTLPLSPSATTIADLFRESATHRPINIEHVDNKMCLVGDCHPLATLLVPRKKTPTFSVGGENHPDCPRPRNQSKIQLILIGYFRE